MPNISQQVLDVTTPYSGDFVKGKYSVFLFEGKQDKDLYILGESITEGFGLYYCYNHTAVPVRVSEERISRLAGVTITSDTIKDFSFMLSEILEEKDYWEEINPTFFEKMSDIDFKISELLSILEVE